KVNQRLVPVFEDLGQRKFIDELGVEEKVWRFYKSCVRTINATGSERVYLDLVPPAKDVNWPQFASSRSEWQSKKISLMTTLANLRNYAVNDIFFNTMLYSDFYDSKRILVSIAAPETRSKRAIFQSEPALKELLIRLDVSLLRATYLAKAIVQLNNEILQLKQDLEFFPSIYTVEEMEADENGGLRWRRFLKTYIKKEIDLDFQLQVFDIDYFKRLGPLLKKYESDVVFSYIMVGFVDFVTSAGYYPTGDNSYDCINVVGYQMQYATKLLYENRYLGDGELQKYESEVQRIFQAIGIKLLKKLNENHFQLNDTQIEALRTKLIAMELNMNNMPSIANHRSFVHFFYQNLELTGEEDYPAAQLKVLKSFASKELSLLKERIPLGPGYLTMQSFQNDYNPTAILDYTNMLIVDFAVLQEPYFAHNSHDIFKVSFLGVMMAIEIVSNFLPPGTSFDAQGIITDLFDNFDESQHYLDAVECLNKSQPEYLSLHLDNFAGVQLAYDTYFDSDSVFNQTQPDFTSIPLKQLFFQNCAQIFLKNYVPKITKLGELGEKTPKSIFTNLKGFSEAFQCPMSEDGMNPPVKCKLF
ncbi:hypothetical protein KR067_006489, partial [Drosophila pandora]